MTAVHNSTSTLSCNARVAPRTYVTMLPSRTQLPAIVLLFTINSLISPAAAQDTPHSQLWGTAGEAWSPASRLPDFSYAGYHFGEVPLPVYPVTANVKDFGAQGDGQTDDTEAFKQAIAQTEQGAILIPAGHYVISDILWLKKPNLVLRGEGSNATVLQITTELEDVRPNMGATTSGKATSNYSWSGGFLWLKGQEKSKPLSAIVSESARGGRQFVLESAAGIELGQRVALRMTDDAQKTLLSHLYSEDSGDTDEITRPVSVDMICRVVAVEANRITLGPAGALGRAPGVEAALDDLPSERHRIWHREPGNLISSQAVQRTFQRTGHERDRHEWSL